MKIGLAASYRYKEGATWDESLAYTEWIARYGEAHGYRNIWMTEHHFSEEVGTGSPVTLLAWLAARTTRIRLGTAVALLPFHHPVRLAEEFLMLDRASGGRVDIGIGRGHAPIESRVLCPDEARSRELFDEGFAIIRLAFTGEAFSYAGDYWQIPRIKLYPPPVQMSTPEADPAVPFYMPITSPRSIEFVARNGIIPLVGYAHEDQVRDALSSYQRTALAAGMSETRLAWVLDRVATNRSVFVGDTFAEAEELAMAELAYPSYSHWMYGLPVGDPSFQPEMPQLPPLTPDRLMAGTAIYGTADQVAEQLLEMDRMGVHHVSVAFSFRSSPEKSKRLAQRFTERVLPKVMPEAALAA